ncbi:MAG: PHP domain-containing protein [Euryarchaeota archaeon]|nr:PHP domain-containing protein [Euryarchaeota archaeon]MBT5254776.1 PHP domain-containing protein [Euryarchaeota archaeon]
MMQWSEQYDLHGHSTHSDGELSVSQLAQKIKDEGVKVWSLTDHDIISGWSEASEEAEKRDIKFIPGVEITCIPGLPAESVVLEKEGRDRATTSWHLLAYFPNYKPNTNSSSMTAFSEWLEPFAEGRIGRMKRMVEKVNQLGMDISFEAVMARSSGAVGRPHLAKEMIEKGYANTVQQVFDEWLGDGRPAHVEKRKPTIVEAVEVIHASGGICSLAHPIYYGIKTDNLLSFIDDAGVDAVEAFHRSHPDSYRMELWKSAQKLGLKVTCGSDYHGPSYQARPGHMPVPSASLPEQII